MNNPQLVTYICIEKPKNCIQYGGTIAAPIVKNVFLDAINILNIEKQENQIEKVKSYYDMNTIKVPNYIGKTKKEINKYNFNIIFKGEGEIVIDQLPKPDELVLDNSTIMLMLGDKK